MTQPPIVPVLVFDVNETLLDITHLEPVFQQIFDDTSVLREWFAQLVLYSQTMTVSGLYTPFGTLGLGALRMTADIHGRTLTDKDIDAFKSAMGQMPAHSDVVPALSRLRDAGFRMVTLTNSAPGPSPSPLEKAGIGNLFEHEFSVDAVQRYKPAPEAYQYVAREMGVQIHDLLLVACHLWDVVGAQTAGCSGAFVVRPHNAMLPASGIPIPTITASDMNDLATQLIARFG